MLGNSSSRGMDSRFGGRNRCPSRRPTQRGPRRPRAGESPRSAHRVRVDGRTTPFRLRSYLGAQQVTHLLVARRIRTSPTLSRSRTTPALDVALSGRLRRRWGQTGRLALCTDGSQGHRSPPSARTHPIGSAFRVHTRAPLGQGQRSLRWVRNFRFVRRHWLSRPSRNTSW